MLLFFLFTRCWGCCEFLTWWYWLKYDPPFLTASSIQTISHSWDMVCYPKKPLTVLAPWPASWHHETYRPHPKALCIWCFCCHIRHMFFGLYGYCFVILFHQKRSVWSLVVKRLYQQMVDDLYSPYIVKKDRWIIHICKERTSEWSPPFFRWQLGDIPWKNVAMLMFV